VPSQQPFRQSSSRSSSSPGKRSAKRTVARRPPAPASQPLKITSRRRPSATAAADAAHASATIARNTTRFSRPGAAADDGLERLQKVLAAAGLGSRRSCEELITTSRVEVDRKIVTQLGTRVDPRRQEIRIDGERLPDPKRVVYMLHKPVGVVTTNFDPSGRPRVVDLVPGEQRLFAIGRLDRMSEGLILVTNDGDLANLLAHPRYGVEKKYLVQVAGVPTPETLEKLRKGISLSEGKARAQRVDLRSQHKLSSVLEMVLDEGKNREIRRMLAKLGHKVHQLKRVAVGGLSLGGLLPGQCRPLSWTEVDTLRKGALRAVGDISATPAQRPRYDGRPERSGRPSRGPGAGRDLPRGRPPARDGQRSIQRDEQRDGPRTGQRDGQRDSRPPAGGMRRKRRPGKASTWRKPRGE